MGFKSLTRELNKPEEIIPPIILILSIIPNKYQMPRILVISEVIKKQTLKLEDLKEESIITLGNRKVTLKQTYNKWED